MKTILLQAAKLPTMEYNEDTEDKVPHESNMRKLQVEYTKPKPNLALVSRLTTATFKPRRVWILEKSPHATEVLNVYPFLSDITQVNPHLYSSKSNTNRPLAVGKVPCSFLVETYAFLMLQQ